MADPLIVSDPKVMMGKPVISGTRITVELVLAKLGSGESIEQLLESHPRLTRDAVLVALQYAARALRGEAVYSTIRNQVYPGRGSAIQAAIDEESTRLERLRLAKECANLDPLAEQALAEEGLSRELHQWPE